MFTMLHDVVETHEFQAQAKKLMNEEEIGLLISLLASDPKMGDVIVGAGGFRKLRFARPGGSKRGGFRVVYFYYSR